MGREWSRVRDRRRVGRRNHKLGGHAKRPLREPADTPSPTPCPLDTTLHYSSRKHASRSRRAFSIADASRSRHRLSLQHAPSELQAKAACWRQKEAMTSLGKLPTLLCDLALRSLAVHRQRAHA